MHHGVVRSYVITCTMDFRDSTLKKKTPVRSRRRERQAQGRLVIRPTRRLLR